MHNKGLKEFYHLSLKKTFDWRITNFGRKISSPVRILWDTLYKCILAAKAPGFDPSKAIYITGTARSGTTWLSGLLSSQQDYCLIFEPAAIWGRYDHINSDTWLTYRNPHSDWPEGKELYANLFTGKSIHPHAFVHNLPYDLIRCKALLIKDIGTNMILPWIASNFNIQGIILIIRHPCAVVGSMRNHFKASQKITPSIRRYVKENTPHLIEYIETLNTVEEKLALRWCCDQHAVLKNRENNHWIEVFYEKLILDGQDELKRIYSALALPLCDDDLGKLKCNSMTVHKWSLDHSMTSKEERLSSWKQRLDDQAVKSILSVVEKFGIHGYNDNIIPNFDNIRVAS